MFPAEMRYIAAVFPRGDLDVVTDRLLKAGLLHFVKTTDIIQRAGLADIRLAVPAPRVTDLRRRVESLLSLAGVAVELPAGIGDDPAQPVPDLDQIAAATESLAGEVAEIRKQQLANNRVIMRIEDLRRHLAAAGRPETPRERRTLEARGHVVVRSGYVSAGAPADLQRLLHEFPVIVVENGTRDQRRYLTVATLRRNDEAVAVALQQVGWQTVEMPGDVLGIDVIADADARIAALRAEQQQQAQRVEGVVQQNATALQSYWTELRVYELQLRIESQLSGTTHTVMVSGWVPSRGAARLERILRAATGDHCFIEWRSAQEVANDRTLDISVPVALTAPPIFRPFQFLVTNFAVPDYGTVDPTLFVAFTYLVMFGLMFADAGHGLVLVLAGLIARRRFTAEQPTYRTLSDLLVWCGVSAVVSGVVFGSYFGMQWLPPLWFDYHGVVTGHAHGGLVNSIYDILAITVYLGVGIIGLGLMLNWINLVVRRRWLDLIFDKGGILGGSIYGIGVVAAALFARSGFRGVPAGGLFLTLLAVPVALLLLKEPLEHLVGLHSRREHTAGTRAAGAGERRAGAAAAQAATQATGPAAVHSRSLVSAVMGAVMAWVLELLELFSGYLANTLSFMRVAGLGIAHVTLMVAFQEIAAMVAGPDGGGIASVAVMVLGNAVVIVLEGLSAGIQSLRLNYYEFFSKFFSGTGTPYKPVSLRNTP